MKRLLLINNGWPTAQQPNYTTYIATISDCLEKAGLQVDRLVIEYEREIGKYYQLWKYLSFWMKLVGKNLRKYDYIYIHHAPYCWTAFFNPTLRRKKVVAHWHGNEVVADSVFLRVARWAICHRMKGCRHVCPSEYFRQVVATKMRFPLNGITVSPSGGVDTSKFCPIDNRDRDHSQQLTLGFSSGMTNAKGADVIMQLVDRVGEIEKRTGRSVCFHIIDYGSDMATYRERLQQSERVVLVRKMPKNDMPTFYNNIDLLLMSSRRSESLGLVVLEAMSCEKPVVTFKNFAFLEFVVPGVSGEMVEMSDNLNRNVDNFIKAIETISRGYPSYSPRSIVVGKYSESFVVGQYRNLFNSLE